jgi:hypothetical protein
MKAISDEKEMRERMKETCNKLKEERRKERRERREKRGDGRETDRNRFAVERYSQSR